MSGEGIKGEVDSAHLGLKGERLHRLAAVLSHYRHPACVFVRASGEERDLAKSACK